MCVRVCVHVCVRESEGGLFFAVYDDFIISSGFRSHLSPGFSADPCRAVDDLVSEVCTFSEPLSFPIRVLLFPSCV